MSNQRTQKLFALLVLLLAGLAVYRPWAVRGFVYDDILVIRDNAFITQPVNLLHLWGPSYLRAAGEQTYRPLVTASYILDHSIWGKTPSGYALTNLLLGVLAAWLLLSILWRVFPDRKPAAGLAAALYLLHPALVETIGLPSNREQILSVLLLLCSAWSWLTVLDDRPRRTRWLAPMWLLAACHVLEWAALGPALLAGLAFVRGADWRGMWRKTWPEWLVVWLYLFLWAFVYPRQAVETPWLLGGPAGGLWAFGVLFWRYVRVALLPLALRPFYTFHSPSLFVGVLAQATLWLVVLGVAIGWLKRKPAALGAGLFLLALLPIGHVLMPFWIVMAERYLALPLIGLLPVLAVLIWRLPKPARWVVAALLVLSWGYLVQARVALWREPLKLWGNATALEPDDPVGWTNLGATLAMYGDYSRAAEAKRQAWEAGKRSSAHTGGLVLTYARGLAKSGREEEACRLLTGEQEHFELSRDWLLAVGQFCAASDRLASNRAFAALLLAGQKDCETWSIFCFLAGDKKESCLQQAFLLCPEDGRLWLQIASLHAAQGNGRKCVQALVMAERDPRAKQWQETTLQILARLKSAQARTAAP